jgi:hypothetical protein
VLQAVSQRVAGPSRAAVVAVPPCEPDARGYTVIEVIRAAGGGGGCVVSTPCSFGIT